MKKVTILLGITVLLLLGSQMLIVSGEEATVKYSLNLSNLADPGNDHYEGWFITSDSAIPGGKFSVNSDGDITNLDGDKIDTISADNVDLDEVTKYVITLEPEGDTNDIPSDIKPVAGDFNSDKTKATLTDNIGGDFSDIFGKYILATPTDNNTDTNEKAGIWYLSLESGSPDVGFGLPDLSATDWIYEGWVIINDYPVTTGTFDAVNVADNASPYSATTVDGPPFPGEDFLQNAPSSLTFPVDISGMKTALTIEPRVDNSESPFQFHILEGDIPTNAVDHMTYDMMDISDTLPTGSLEIMEDGSAFLPGFGLALGMLALFLLAPVVVNKTRRSTN